MGGGGLYPLGLGQAYPTYLLIKSKYPKRTICFGGVSSGSWTAFMLSLGLNMEQIQSYFNEFRQMFDKWYKFQFIYWFINIEKLLQNILNENGGFKQIQNTLFVGITTWNPTNKRFEFKSVSNFKSDKDVIDALMASCHVLIAGRNWIRYYDGQIAMDGNFIQGNVILNDYINILIRYEFRFDNKHLSDSMLNFCPNKWDRLVDQGIKQFERNKWNHIAQIEKNQDLPDYWNQSVVESAPIWKKVNTLINKNTKSIAMCGVVVIFALCVVSIKRRGFQKNSNKKRLTH